MDGGVAAVLAAIVTAIGAIIIAIMQFRSMREENRTDHGIVAARLDHVIDIVSGTSTKLTSHLDWHLTKESAHGQTVKANKEL